jgi:hypothetical protein
VIETRTDDTKLSNSLQGVNKVDFFSSVSKDINDPSKLKCFYEFLKARYESRKGYIDNLIHGNAPASTEKQILESLSKSSSAHSVEDALVTYSFGSQYGFGSSDCKNPFFLGCYSDIQSIPAFRDARKLPREMDTRISNTMVQAGYTELRLSHIVSSENNIGKLIGRSLSIWVNTGYLASVYKGNKCALQKDLLKDKGIVAHAKLAWAEHMMDISDKSDDHRMIRAMHKLKEECSKLTIGYKSPLGDNSNCGDEENNNQPIKPRAELEVELEVMRKRIAELESELTRTKHELDALKVKEVKAEVETQASVIEFPEYQQDQHSNCSQPVSSVDIAITVSHEVAVYELRRGHKLMSAVKKASNIVKSLKPRGLFFVDSIISQNDVEVATDINENGCYDAIDNLIDDLTDYRDRFSRDPRCSAIEYELITWLANTPIDLCPPDWDHF